MAGLMKILSLVPLAGFALSSSLAVAQRRGTGGAVRIGGADHGARRRAKRAFSQRTGTGRLRKPTVLAGIDDFFEIGHRAIDRNQPHAGAGNIAQPGCRVEKRAERSGNVNSAVESAR